MNLKAVSALYRLPAETTMADLTEDQVIALWALRLHLQSESLPENAVHGVPSMLLSEWMDREVEAASQGSLNPQN